MAAVVREKIPPRYYSYAAIAAAFLVGGALWVAGGSNPRRFAVTMAINHHDGYGGVTVGCYQCHVPRGGALTATITVPDCLTSNCHGDLQPGTPADEALRIATMLKDQFPDAGPRAQHYLDMHAAVRDQECWACHAEHRYQNPKWPKGWAPYKASIDVDKVSWVSIRGDRNRGG